MKRLLSFVLPALSLGLTGSMHAVGFNQTAGGTYDYDEPTYWDGGIVNGIWDSSLIVTGDQILTFDGDKTLANGLFIDHSPASSGAGDLTFRGDGTNRTITLGGDITVTPSNNQTIEIGSLTSGQFVNVALGGNRTFTVESGDLLRFYNTYYD